MTHYFLNLIGQTFGRLRVSSKTSERRRGYVVWECLCECGTTHLAMTHALVTGNTQSCGCLRSDTSRANVKKRAAPPLSPDERVIYHFWHEARQRCLNPNNKAYKDYGGRGIAICDAWLADWRNVLADMGPRPTPSHSMDRIENDLGYSPGNCRWATPSQQSANRRNCKRVLVNGIAMPLAEAAHLDGIPTSRARYLFKTGRYYPEATSPEPSHV